MRKIIAYMPFQKALFILNILAFYAPTCGIALADNETTLGASSSKAPQAGSTQMGQNLASPNFYKEKDFLPGEEVVTPTGKKMKVWSTKGPVEVSPAPQPFQNQNSQVLDNGNILIDAESIRRRRIREESRNRLWNRSNQAGANRETQDSFDLSK